MEPMGHLPHPKALWHLHYEIEVAERMLDEFDDEPDPNHGS